MRVLLLVLTLLLSGCGGYELKNLAKSDIDLVTDEFIAETRSLVRELTVKLYKRNPDQMRKVPGMTLEKRLFQLLNSPGELNFEELAGRQETDALELVFNPHFDGDRVFALVVGLVLWGEMPDLASIGGGALIVGAAVQTHRLGRREAREER